MPFFGDKVKPTKVGQHIADASDVQQDQSNNFVNQDAKDFSEDEITRDGSRFALSENVDVNPSNVIVFTSSATGSDLNTSKPYFTSNPQDGPTPTRSAVFSSQNIQFSALEGGTLTLMISLQSQKTSGFLPDLTNLVLDYGSGISFEFPLSPFSPEAGIISIPIPIPNAVYTPILNSNCTVTLNYLFRGSTFVGDITILGLMNTREGSLSQGINAEIGTAINQSEKRTDNDLARLSEEIDNQDGILNSLSPRISPYRNEDIQDPYHEARFLDSTGSDSFPSAVSAMTPVHFDNPRFTVSGSAVFVAVEGGVSYAFRNVTQNSIVSLDDSSPNVDLGASLTFNGSSYFIYRVTGLTANDVLEIDRTTRSQVLAWPTDITSNQKAIAQIEAELKHALLNLPATLVDVLDNEVTVTEETTPTYSATSYNIGLGNTGNQTVFRESNPNAPSSGTVTSKPINETTGNRARRKLIYIAQGETYNNQNYIVANNPDTSSGTDLVSYDNGTFFAKRFIPAIPQGSTNVTVYPAPSNRVSGDGVWQTVPTLTFQNGIPVPEADELFFTRNIPSASTEITINYRGHANGNLFGAGSATLAANANSVTFVLDDGSETVTVEVLRTGGNIRVSATERVNTGLPTINDVQVILSYTETRVVPAVAESVRDVEIESVSENAQVFAIKPSSTDTLIIVGSEVEVDTGYSYTTLFGASESGTITVTSVNGSFLDYQDFNPINTTIQDLEDHSALPNFGLFSVQYTHATIVELATQLIVSDSSGNRYNVGDALNALGATSL